MRNKSKEKADLTDRSDTRFFQSVIKSETPVGKIKVYNNNPSIFYRSQCFKKILIFLNLRLINL